MRNVIYIFGVIILLYSCNKSDEYNFDLDTFGQIKANEIFKKIEVIPLENNSEAMIDVCQKFVYYGNKYYVLDLYVPLVKMFDEKGKFISSIGVNGRGPGELIDITDFEVNRFTNNIEICGNVKSLIVTYDSLNRFKGQHLLPNGTFTVDKFYHITDDVLALMTSMHPKENLLLYSKKEDKIISRFSNGINGHFNLSIYSDRPFSHYNNIALFTDIYSSTVYEFDTTHNKLKEYKKFSFGKYDFDKSILPPLDIFRQMSFEKKSEIIAKVRKLVTPADGFFETDKYWLYLKRNSEIILKNKITNSVYKFNSLDGGKYFFIRGMTDNYIYAVLPSEVIQNCISEDMVGKEEFEKVRSLKPEDNQVVIKYYFK
jgi:hypothetical protein